ncbi:MAG TPA: single-stranded DNA-binding protein [Bryobacteraceae bacterium]|nr:single-stranded DNA-binding protein [Bryobacteraceae bacterium]
MYLNQLTIIGFLGQNPEVKFLPNGTAVTKFSVATKKSWKDDTTGDWKEKTQWHSVVAYGEGYQQAASRLQRGSHVMIQGELQTRQYDKKIQIPSGKKTLEQTVKMLVVELKADTIKSLDRAGSSEEIAEPAPDSQEAPL